MDMETGKPSSGELCCVSGCAVWGWGCLEDQGSKAPRVSMSDVVQLSEAPKAFRPVPEVLSLERRWNADRALVFATGKTELAKQTAKYIHKDVKKVKLLSPVLVAMCAAGRPQPRIRRQRWAEGAQLLSMEGFSIESFGLRTKQTGSAAVRAATSFGEPPKCEQSRSVCMETDVLCFSSRVSSDWTCRSSRRGTRLVCGLGDEFGGFGAGKAPVIL